jgi:hypothetical protein
MAENITSIERRLLFLFHFVDEFFNFSPDLFMASVETATDARLTNSPKGGPVGHLLH